MSDSSSRFTEPTECPHCGEATLPNRLADGSVVCSCPAQRRLGPQRSAAEAPPVDDAAFGSGRGIGELPADKGQFGTDVATELYRTMPPAPDGERGRGDDADES